MPIQLDVNKQTDVDQGQTTKSMGSSKLGKDEFLKLMITQLQNQDPLSPADSQAFVAQLAQFSTLELMQNSNSSLEKLIVGQSKNQQTQLASLVGKDVLFHNDQVVLKDGHASTGLAELSENAADVTAVVSDINGRVVRTLHLGAHDAGTIEVNWDGREDSGMLAAGGRYTVLVTAADKDGNALSVDQRGSGRVSGVNLENDPPELLIGDSRIKLSEIVEIKERSTQ